MNDEEKIAGKVINYVQKRTKKMDIPFKLTVKGYQKFYLNNHELEDLTPEEQTILFYVANDKDPTKTPENTVAAIFRARNILKRSKDESQALKVCFKLLYEQNQDTLNEMREQEAKISALRSKASQLQYYLDVRKEMRDYDKGQNSILSPFINLKNKFLHLIRRRPSSGPPHTDEELEYSIKFWKDFRAEQHSPDNLSDREVLKRFKYGPKGKAGEPFKYARNRELLDALQEDYNITNIALQILDGSAYNLAKEKMPYKKNVFPYLKTVSETEEKAKSLTKTKPSQQPPDEHEF